MLLTEAVMERLQQRKLRLLTNITHHLQAPERVVMLSASLTRGDRESGMTRRFGVGVVPGAANPEFAVLSHLALAKNDGPSTPYLDARAAAIRRAAEAGIRTGRAQSYAGEMAALGSPAISARGADSRR
jgi:hypothetical protein